MSNNTPALLTAERMAYLRDLYPWGEPLVPAEALTNEGRVIRELLTHIDALEAREKELVAALQSWEHPKVWIDYERRWVPCACLLCVERDAALRSIEGAAR